MNDITYDGVTQFSIEDPLFDWATQDGIDLLDACAGYALRSQHAMFGPSTTTEPKWSLWAVRELIDDEGRLVAVSLAQQISGEPEQFLAEMEIGDLDDSYVALILAGDAWGPETIVLSAELGGDIRIAVHGAIAATRFGLAGFFRPTEWIGDDPGADPAVRLDDINLPESAQNEIAHTVIEGRMNSMTGYLMARLIDPDLTNYNTEE